jgi:hypothetical protein
MNVRGGVVFCGLIAAGLAFASCREPTQITLVVTTDAQCLGEGAGPTLLDTFVASGVELPNAELVAASVTEQCTPKDADNMVGTLVLIPGDGDQKRVDVVVIGGVDSASSSDESGAPSLGADACRALLETGQSIDGQPCILARRRLGFVDHKKLTLPIKLDKRCIGVECEEDQTCFGGNCVSAEIECLEETGDCTDPLGCALPCADACVSGSGTCDGGSCTCAPCDETACGAICGAGKIAACSEGVCTCSPACDQASCDLCGGTCNGATCQCAACDPTECGMTTCPSGLPAECAPTCTCPGACDGPTCAMQTCSFGQEGQCEAGGCVCRCEPTTCAADCTSAGIGDGGSCNAEDVCVCNPICNQQVCGVPPAIGHVFDGCDMGICQFRCDNPTCDAYCAGQGMAGSCSEETALGICSCSGGTSSSVVASSSVSTAVSTSTGGSCMPADCAGGCSPGEDCTFVAGTCDCECNPSTCPSAPCAGGQAQCVADISVPGGSHCACIPDGQCIFASPFCDAACIEACSQSGCILACSGSNNPCDCVPQ